MIRRARIRMPWCDLAVMAVVLLVIGGPAIFTSNGFGDDFTNHLWLVWVQSRAISQHLTPTYFVNAPAVGVFYPFFAFYGGTLYAASGAVAALLGGNAELAYIGVTLLAVAAAYGGLLWLARQLGVRSWLAHAPAITFVASAYYVTNLYGRGAWPEFMATSTIPLLVASGYKLAHSRRIEPVPAALFVLAVIFFAGSHNVTLELGSLLLIVGGLLAWLALGGRLLLRGPRRGLELAVLLALGFAVNAWFLLPDIVHASQTAIGSGPLAPWSLTSFLNTPGLLFNPLRAVPRQSVSTTPALFVQAPDWFLAWSLIAGAVLWSRTDRRLRRAAGVLIVLLVITLVLIMIGPVWDAMPRLLQEVQLPFRLNTYVALCTAGLVLISVRALQGVEVARLRRGLSGGLAAATVASISLCVWQLWVPNTDVPASYRDRGQVFLSPHLTPRTWYDSGNYADVSQRVIAAVHGVATVDPTWVNADHVSIVVDPPPGGAPFATNVLGGPYVVAATGDVVRVGRTAMGAAVLRRTKRRAGPIILTLGAGGGSLVAGRWISLAALGLLWVLACYAVADRLWRR